MPDFVGDLTNGAIIGVAAVGANFLVGSWLAGIVGAGAVATVVVVAIGYTVAKYLHFA